MKKTIALIIAVFAVFTSYARKETASHVFFIGLDSWGSYSMAKADMPNVRRLMENGWPHIEEKNHTPLPQRLQLGLDVHGSIAGDPRILRVGFEDT